MIYELFVFKEIDNRLFIAGIKYEIMMSLSGSDESINYRRSNEISINRIHMFALPSIPINIFDRMS